MMKKLRALALLSLLAASAALVGQPTPARCVICPVYVCYSTSGCGHECVCLRVGNQRSGRCVYFNTD